MTRHVRQWFRNLPLTRKLNMVFLLPVACLLVITFVTIFALRDLLSADLLARKSDRIMIQATRHLELLYSTQNAFRGYILTQDPMFSSLLDGSRKDLEQAGLKLGELVQDSPSPFQRQRVHDLQQITKQHLEEVNQAYRKMQEGRPEAGLAYIQSGRGPARGMAIRRLLDEFETEADRIHRVRLSNVEQKRAFLFWVVLGGAIGTLLVTGCGIMIAARSVTVPMTDLSRTAQRISRGEEAAFLDPNRRDEVGVLSRSLAEMNVQIRTHMQRLAVSESRYRSLVERIPMGIYTTHGTRWTFANRMQRELMGLPEGVTPTFHDWATMLHPDDRSRVLVEFKDAIQRRLPFEASFRILRSDGSLRHVLSRGVPVGPFSAEGVPYLCMDLDVTEMEQLQQRVVTAEPLAALTRMATSIAHDLRMPLIGIERGLQGLRFATEGHLHPEAEDLLRDVHGATRMAVGIVQDIMDLYRHAHGELHLSYSRFNLKGMVQEIIELMKPEILDRRLTIALEAESVEAQADRRRLDRVMVNLLDNAIKNSPKGGTVSIKVSTEEGEVRRLAVLTIEDQGKGLDPVALRALLDTNRLVSTPTREGTGLGLYLCRLVVGAHQGTLAAENRDNGGARFIVSIPTEVDLGDQSLARR